MSELRPFGDQLDSFQQLVDSFFGRNNLPALSDTRFNMPATDISENDNSYTISAELPGIKKEDVKVTLHEGVLSIEAESKSEHEEKGDKQIRTERRYGKFVRRLNLGTDIKEEAIEASFKDGVLNLVVPKKKESTAATPKAIKVK